MTTFGIELEYMIVDRQTLDVRPICDRVLFEAAGYEASDIEFGDVAWSNELALHVIEIKSNGPTDTLEGWPQRFSAHVRRINEILGEHDACLLPGGMHPWMNPDRDFQLWPHDNGAIYAAFDRIFDCRGHGWANLQSVHLNLSFEDDASFARLHAAIRLVLPLLPALAASSPLREGRTTGLQDTRLEVYRTNSQRIPLITAAVVPEPAWSHDEYQRDILQPLYQAIAPLDPEGVLQYEWLNARGAIARFDRNTIEVRVLDVQECPYMDVAICAAAYELITGCRQERWATLADQQAAATLPLANVLQQTIAQGRQAMISDPEYLRLFGLGPQPRSAGELWTECLRPWLSSPAAESWRTGLHVLLQQGSLSERLLSRLGAAPNPDRQRQVYRDLSTCLAEHRIFGATIDG